MATPGFGATAPADIAPSSDAVSASYAMAFGLTRARSYGLAETAWRNFLSQYPDHPLAGSAQYFLGETFFGRNDFSHAALAYETGLEKYPQSDVAPQTLLKLGISLGRTGETASACAAFARLDRQFPKASGVIREREMVERQQYHCPEALAVPTPAVAAPAIAAPAIVTPAVAAPAVAAPAIVTPAVAAPAVAAPAITSGARAPSEETPAKLAGVGVAPAPAAVGVTPAPAVVESPRSATPPGGSVPDRSGMPDKVAEVEPAPPAQPLTPVERKALSGLDAERAAAKAALYVTPPPSAPPHRASAKAESAPHAAGSSPEAIKAAQILLAALSYDAGPVNGQPGTKLSDAVRAFEKRNQMRPDGEVSDQLLQRLSAAVAAHKTAAPVAPVVPIAAPVRAIAGTGFIVSRSGFVVTSNHLVAECKEIRGRSLAVESTEMSLVAADARNDLALLRLKLQTDAGVTPVSFRDGRGPRHGDGIVVTGLSLGDDGSSDFYLTAGIVSALSGRDDSGAFKVSVPISAESGSAPVFDTSGHVVAILGDGTQSKTGGDATVRAGLAVRATIARNFLEAHNVDYDSAPATRELKATEIGDAAKEAVVLVECRR
jgi:tol-pal system protein YbgF